MTRSQVPWAPILVGVGALVLIAYRVITGQWSMVSVVTIGVLGTLATLMLYLRWDARVYQRALNRLESSGTFDVVVGGYLTLAEVGNHPGDRPPMGECAVAANRSGIEVHSVTRPNQVLLAIAWDEIIDLGPGRQPLLGQSLPAVMISTMLGRVGIIPRTDPARGITSAGGPETATLIESLRRLRPGSIVG